MYSEIFKTKTTEIPTKYMQSTVEEANSYFKNSKHFINTIQEIKNQHKLYY